MLEATLPRNPITNLIPFVPRQVTLAQHQTMKTKNLPSENGFTNETLKSSKKDKTKKKKSSSSSCSSKVSSLFHQSIATYLEHNGFSKTLDVFRSEASIGEVDGSNVAACDLYEIFSKDLESSKFDSKASINVNEEIGLGNDTLNENNIAELNLVENKSADPADSIKKKKKKSKGSDTGVVDEQPADSSGFTKCEKGNEKSTNGVVSESPIKSHKKKKRSEPVTDCYNEDQADYTISEPQLDESNKKPKDKKKKKSKTVSAENDGQSSLQVLESKGAKKKKHKSKSESSVGNIGEDTSEIANTVSVEEEKKGSKKRKRSTSDENESQLNDKSLTKEAKKSNAEGSEDDKGNDPSLQSIPILKSEENAGKKRKTENSHVDSQRSQSDQQHKSSSGCEDLENKGREGSASQKSLKKQQNGSAEPKTVNAFQRVKIDKVEFADDRLQDNSYWAKDGAEIGYGAKAQEVLGQVRGRDFRHEKTKKKRGSYRGGQIDLQSHSVKFNYSDDD